MKFYDWLLGAQQRLSPSLQLFVDDVWSDPYFPEGIDSLEDLLAYLRGSNAQADDLDRAIVAFILCTFGKEWPEQPALPSLISWASLLVKTPPVAPHQRRPVDIDPED
jgi:hypothetical protein